MYVYGAFKVSGESTWAGLGPARGVRACPVPRLDPKSVVAVAKMRGELIQQLQSAEHVTACCRCVVDLYLPQREVILGLSLCGSRGPSGLSKHNASLGSSLAPFAYLIHPEGLSRNLFPIPLVFGGQFLILVFFGPESGSTSKAILDLAPGVLAGLNFVFDVGWTEKPIITANLGPLSLGSKRGVDTYFPMHQTS